MTLATEPAWARLDGLTKTRCSISLSSPYRPFAVHQNIKKPLPRTDGQGRDGLGNRVPHGTKSVYLRAGAEGGSLPVSPIQATLFMGGKKAVYNGRRVS